MARFTVNFTSHTLMRSVEMTVIIPSITQGEAMDAAGGPPGKTGLTNLTYAGRGNYPILYLLHGYGGNHTDWTAYSNAQLYADEHRIAMVMISAENKCYVNAYGEDRFADFFSRELPDFVQHMFPVSKRPEDTYIAGLSMGGYGALLHGMREPQKYRAIGAFSAAVVIDPKDHTGQSIADADLTALLKACRERGDTLPDIYLSCGEKDFLFRPNEAFRDTLKKNGATVLWTQVPGYGHEWCFWDKQLESFLKWLPRTDTYAPQKPQKA